MWEDFTGRERGEMGKKIAKGKHVKMKTRAQWEEEGRKEKVMFEDYKRSQEAQINYTPLPLLPWKGQ